MGILKRFIDNYREKKQRYNEVKEEYEIQKKVVERQKSANERELERYHEEERQGAIENELQKQRKKRKNEMWHSTNLMGKKARNNFKLGGSMLSWR